MIKQENNTNTPIQKITSNSFPYLKNSKNIVIKLPFNILAQSNMSVSNCGKIVICQNQSCVIVDLVNINKTQYRVIPILKGDSYHWVYSWKNGFLIIGDIQTQFIDEDYILHNMNILIQDFYYYPNTEDLYIVQFQENIKYIWNFKESRECKKVVSSKHHQKLRGKINYLEHQITIQSKQLNEQPHNYSYNINTQQKQIIILPPKTINFLKVNDTLLYFAHGQTATTLNSKKNNVQQSQQIDKFIRPTSFYFASISNEYNLVGIQNGYKIQLINYKTNKIVQLQNLFDRCMRNSDCQIMSGNMKYYVLMKYQDGALYLNCNSFISKKNANIHLFTKSHLMQRYGKTLLETMLLKI